jgi:NACalpha-BTF3-like transcription factor
MPQKKLPKLRFLQPVCDSAHPERGEGRFQRWTRWKMFGCKSQAVDVAVVRFFGDVGYRRVPPERIVTCRSERGRKHSEKMKQVHAERRKEREAALVERNGGEEKVELLMQRLGLTREEVLEALAE